MTSAKVLRLADGRILVAADRNVEFAFGIDAPQAVKAGLVEVDEASGDFYAVVKLMLAADVVVVAFVVLCRVFAQLGD